MSFSLSPSHWINSGWILFGLIGLPLIIPPLISLYMIIYISCWKYEFYDDHIIEQTGVFTINRTELNLYRVKSVKLVQPFLYRLVGLSTVYIQSSDPFKPQMKLVAIPEGNIMINSIREQVNSSRQKMGLKESDIHIL
jgi:uncharacterized membrane protein YdbT with pleckstrin-like domain